jgi:hypothetical protein
MRATRFKIFITRSDKNGAHTFKINAFSNFFIFQLGPISAWHLLGFPNRVVFNDWGTSRPCLFPPMAVKSKPPAVRVVVDSGLNILKLIACFVDCKL